MAAKRKPRATERRVRKPAATRRKRNANPDQAVTAGSGAPDLGIQANTVVCHNTITANGPNAVGAQAVEALASAAGRTADAIAEAARTLRTMGAIQTGIHLQGLN